MRRDHQRLSGSQTAALEFVRVVNFLPLIAVAHLLRRDTPERVAGFHRVSFFGARCDRRFRFGGDGFRRFFDGFLRIDRVGGSGGGDGGGGGASRTKLL